MEIFRFVDAVGGATRLDLLDENGWMLHRGFDIGQEGIEKVYLAQPPYTGATLAASYRGIVTMTIALSLMKQATRLDMKTKMAALATELDRNTNYLEFRPTGFTAEGLGSYYALTYQSNIPTLLRSVPHPSSFKALQSVTPIVLSLDRDPELLGEGVFI